MRRSARTHRSARSSGFLICCFHPLHVFLVTLLADLVSLHALVVLMFNNHRNSSAHTSQPYVVHSRRDRSGPHSLADVTDIKVGLGQALCLAG